MRLSKRIRRIDFAAGRRKLPALHMLLLWKPFESLLDLFPERPCKWLTGRFRCTVPVVKRFFLGLVRFLIGVHPDAIRTVSDSGDLPMHYACRNSAAPSVLEHSVQKHPDAVKTLSGMGLLPLHYLCAINAELPVIEYFVQKDPSTVWTVSGSSDLPLHHACCCNMRLSTIEYLVQQ
jgi:hypothetical protein